MKGEGGRKQEGEERKREKRNRQWRVAEKGREEGRKLERMKKLEMNSTHHLGQGRYDFP